MQKIIFILLIINCLTSCYITKSGRENISAEGDTKSDSIILNEIKKNNITSESFFIQKAEIEIISGGEKQKFVSAIKFCKPDSFLISIRSNAGIEAARILLTKDTILINDRINKILYIGSKEDGRKKYGLSNAILPVLFGDLIINKKDENSVYQCVNNVCNIILNVDGYKLNYSINCKNKKAVSLLISRDTDTRPVYLKYNGFDDVGKILIYKRVTINDIDRFDVINITLNKVVIPWEANIRFIPGNNYEKRAIK